MKKTVFEKVKQIYLCLLAVYAILREVVPLQFVVNNSLLTCFFFGMGLVLIAADMLVNKLASHGKTTIVLMVFLAICGVSTLVNYKYEFVSNVKAICWMVLFFLLIYPWGRQLMQGGKQEMVGLFYSAIVTFTLLVIISLPMYFFDVDYVYTNFNEMGIRSSQGFSNFYMRLWGVFQDANRAAVYGFVVMLMAVYLFFKEPRKLVKVLLTICVFLIFWYIVLTLSRTAQLTIMLVCGWSAFYWAFAKSKKEPIKKILISAGACLAAVAICFGAFSAMTTMTPYVKKLLKQGTSQSLNTSIHQAYDSWYRFAGISMFEGYWVEPEESVSTEPTEDTEVTEGIEAAENTEATEGKKDPDEEELKRTDEKADDISNGRFDRWKDGILIFLESPVIGASPRGVNAFANDHCPDTYAALYNRNIHNSFLEILAGTGILGFAVIAVLLVITVCNILKTAFTRKFSGKLLLFSGMVLTLFCFGVLTSDLFFILTFGSVMFWVALGAINEGREEA